MYGHAFSLLRVALDIPVESPILDLAAKNDIFISTFLDKLCTKNVQCRFLC